MLRIIEGRAGSGKTEKIFSEIKALAERQNKKIVLMVPEQFTAMSEKALVSYLGNRLANGIEVLSFNRVSDFVFKSLGGIAARRISNAGRYIAMNRALESVRDNLEVYKTTAEYIGFVESLVKIADEFEAYCITPETVEENMDKLTPSLAGKLADITLITEAYKSIVGEGVHDSSQELAIATAKLAESSLFEGYTFYFDSYSGFTPNQLEFIQTLLPRLENAVFTLTGEGVDRINECEPQFLPSAKTYARLVQLAKRAGVSVHAPERCQGCKFSEDIAHIEKNVFLTVPQRVKASGDVQLACAKNAQAEVEFAAGDILRRCREDGLSYADFALICRNDEDYKDIVERVFAKYKIPVFLSVEEDFVNTPLALLVLSALRCVSTGFTYQNIFGYLKSGFTSLSDADICELEAYAYSWNIRGSRWTAEEDWSYHPDGYNMEHNAHSQKKLDRINATRRAALKEILKLKEEVKGVGAAEISRAVYSMLESLGVREKLEEESTSASAVGNHAKAARISQYWEILVGALEQLALFGGEKLTVVRYAELLRMALASQHVSTIPAVSDAVTFGAADRIRTQNIKASYILGMNEGVFPASSFDEGIISDRERESLLEIGIELAPTAEKKIDDERFLCYCALTSAERALTVTCSASGVGGKKSKGSYVYKALCNMFEFEEKSGKSVFEKYVDTPEIRSAIESENAAFEYLILSNNAKNTAVNNALEEYFSGLEDYARKKKSIDEAISTENAQKELKNKCNVEELYRGRPFAPTRIEKFSKCSFSHFCEYGLKLKPIEKRSFSAMEIGTFMHSIVENYFKYHSNEPSESQAATVDRLIQQYLDANAKDFADGSERIKVLFSKMRRVLNTYISNIRAEFATSKFRPIAFELQIGGTGEVGAYKVGNYEIGGKIDRVDGYLCGDKLYVRVVDYKTGSKAFSFDEAAYGIGLQMLLYLFALCDNGKETFGFDIEPAGVLYSPLRSETVSVSRETSKETLEKLAKAQNVSKGILLNDESILHAMDTSGTFGLLPIKLDKKGFKSLSGGTLITAAQFDLFKQFTEKKLGEIISQIENGNIGISPIGKEGYLPCGYCKMAPICRFDDQTEARCFEKITGEQFFAAIEGDGENG